MASPDELWLVDFGDPFPGEPAEHRPAVILGPASDVSERFPVVFVVPLMATNRALSFHVEIEALPSTGLTHTSYAQCELVRSISRRRLVHRLGAIRADDAHRIETVLKRLLGW